MHTPTYLRQASHQVLHAQDYIRQIYTDALYIDFKEVAYDRTVGSHAYYWDRVKGWSCLHFM